MNTLRFLLLLSFVSAHGQFLADHPSRETTKAAIDKIYNFEFREAENLLIPVYKKYENHPVSFLLQSQIVYWQNYPIEANPDATGKYLNLLRKCQAAAGKLYKNELYRDEALFYLLSSHGSISRVHHYKKDYLKAAVEAKNAYGYLKEGFHLSSKISDFLFTKGLYNFYRVQYPETHPQIKPAIYFFKNGNKTQGLEELRQAGAQALFTGVEARYFLAGICLKYENRNQEALAILSKLYALYPNNPLFLMRYIEALLINNQQEKAETLNNKMAAMRFTDQKMAYLVFKGMIEWKGGRVNESGGFFEKALQGNREGSFTKDLRPMAELMLGKVHLKKGDKAKAKYYISKAIDSSEYSWVSQEAKKIKENL